MLSADFGNVYREGDFFASRNCDIMACFKAYFDESGTDASSPIMAVGGAIAEISSWLSVSSQWRTVLCKYRVSAFHASEYNTRHADFVNWDDEKRHGFTDELFSIIDKEDIRSLGFVIYKQDYERIVRDFPGLQISPYQLLCYACCNEVTMFYELRGNIPPIEIIFEQGQPFHFPQMDKVINDIDSPSLQSEYGIAAITLMQKTDAVQLQLADFIVYELFKAHMRQLMQAPEKPRHQTTMLNKVMRGFAPKLSCDMIREFLTAFSNPGS